jgi:hypothetical protein
MHLEVVASKVGYLNILQDRVCALFILQAKAGRVLVGQCRLLWLEVSFRSRQYESSPLWDLAVTQFWTSSGCEASTSTSGNPVWASLEWQARGGQH